MIDYDTIPPTILSALRRYADDHMPTGGFLRAVLSNDLMEAVGRADVESLAALHSIAGYVYNEMPGNCHGSREVYDKWTQTGCPKCGATVWIYDLQHGGCTECAERFAWQLNGDLLDETSKLLAQVEPEGPGVE